MEKKKVLVVDDAEINRDILESILEPYFEVVKAESGNQAISILTDNPMQFSFVLLDIVMSDGDGFSVLEFMKRERISESIPVMMLTDNHEKETIIRAYSLGAVDFLEKPYLPTVILKRMESVMNLYDMGYRDSLTGGLNRRAFLDNVENALKKAHDPSEYAIFFFDIKHFKAINELFGLQTADSILIKFYNDLVVSELYPIFTSRIEADHFVCLVRKENIDLKRAATRMEATLSIMDKKIRFYGVFGVYMIEDASMPVSVMIDRASMAKDTIVDESVRPYAVYDDSMKSDYVYQAEALAEFENGIENDEFAVYYQPVIEAATGKLVSAEALVRWIHPQKGFVSPAAFIPALEKNGHISKLDRYMVDKVHQTLTQRASENLPIIPVSVNLSWMDFYDDHMVRRLVDLLESNGIASNRIRLEVTETSYAALDNNHSNLIKNFRMFGAMILLDDFGTGFSSFGMLENYCFDLLKIDMSFVRKITTNEKSQVIIKGIIDICHELGIRTIAEGVETQEQVDFLKERGCDYLQGYYYAKPLPQEEFMAFMKRYQEQDLLAI